MGLLEVLNELNLDDDVRKRLEREHQSEMGSLTSDNATLRANARRKDVDAEVKTLADLFGDESVGLVKFTRRVLLSDDDDAGIVLLSDADLNLSGDDAVGATSREEMSAAGVLRKFVELMPRSQEGKLKIELSDQALAANAANPPKIDDNVDPNERSNEARERMSQRLGRPIDRPARSKRYRQGGHVIAAGGES